MLSPCLSFFLPHIPPPRSSPLHALPARPGIGYTETENILKHSPRRLLMLIKNGFVTDPGTQRAGVYDIRIEDGLIPRDLRGHPRLSVRRDRGCRRPDGRPPVLLTPMSTSATPDSPTKRHSTLERSLPHAEALPLSYVWQTLHPSLIPCRC